MRQLRSQNPVYLRDLADLLAREVKGFSDDVSHLIETCLTELMQNVFEWAQSPTHRRRAGVLMYVIDVWEVCGGKLKDRDDAVPLRRAIQTAWSDEQPVEVDFGDHRIASVSFLDEGIAVLFLEHDVPVVQRRVQLVNITASDRRLLNETIAKRVAQRTSRQPTGPVTSR